MISWTLILFLISSLILLSRSLSSRSRMKFCLESVDMSVRSLLSDSFTRTIGNQAQQNKETEKLWGYNKTTTKQKKETIKHVSISWSWMGSSFKMSFSAVGTSMEGLLSEEQGVQSAAMAVRKLKERSSHLATNSSFIGKFCPELAPFAFSLFFLFSLETLHFSVFFHLILSLLSSLCRSCLFSVFHRSCILYSKNSRKPSCERFHFLRLSFLDFLFFLDRALLCSLPNFQVQPSHVPKKTFVPLSQAETAAAIKAVLETNADVCFFGCFSESLDSLFHFLLCLKTGLVANLSSSRFHFCHRVATAFYWCLTSHDGLSPRTGEVPVALAWISPSFSSLLATLAWWSWAVYRDHGSRWRGRFPENKLTFSQRCLLETALLSATLSWNFGRSSFHSFAHWYSIHRSLLFFLFPSHDSVDMTMTTECFVLPSKRQLNVFVSNLVQKHSNSCFPGLPLPWSAFLLIMLLVGGCSLFVAIVFLRT